jgi:cytoskeletal protein CcmA (bactofilin family)
VQAGEHAGDLRTVNGEVTIGEGAMIRTARTGTGRIDLARGATATSVSTVNGEIRLAEDGHVEGAMRAVNGALHLAPHASVTGEVANVNGSIRVEGAHVGGQLSTVNGDVDVVGGAQVESGMIIGDEHSSGSERHMPRIVIGPGSEVRGVLRFRRPVHLYVSDRATIGTVEGATVEHFSGETPPQ